jgi:hypothetical protein
LLGLCVEEVHAARVQPQANLVARLDLDARIDPGRDLVTTDLAVEELI